MTWEYKEALFYGSKTDPQPGDSVTIVIEDASDEENVLTKEFAWGYDGKKTKAQFVAMVKQEIRAHIQHLNASFAGEDVTDLFEPEV